MHEENYLLLFNFILMSFLGKVLKLNNESRMFSMFLMFSLKRAVCRQPALHVFKRNHYLQFKFSSC